MVCEQRTMQFALSRGLDFEYMPPIKVKGKSGHIQVYRPYPRQVLMDPQQNKNLLLGLQNIYHNQYELLVRYRLQHNRPTIACFANIKPLSLDDDANDQSTKSIDTDATAHQSKAGNKRLNEGSAGTRESSGNNILPGRKSNGKLDTLSHLSPLQSQIQVIHGNGGKHKYLSCCKITQQ